MAFYRYQPAYIGVHPWDKALRTDCFGWSVTPIFSSHHFSHNALLTSCVGGTQYPIKDLSIHRQELNRLSNQPCTVWVLFDSQNSLVNGFFSTGMILEKRKKKKKFVIHITVYIWINITFIMMLLISIIYHHNQTDKPRLAKDAVEDFSTKHKSKCVVILQQEIGKRRTIVVILSQKHCL